MFCFLVFSPATTPVDDKEAKSRNGSDSFILKFLKFAYSSGVELNCETLGLILFSLLAPKAKLFDPLFFVS